MLKISKLFRESKVIKNYSIFDFKDSKTAYYYKAKLDLIDNNVLYVKEYISSAEHLYSYHWQIIDGNLITRGDNSPHHKAIKTFPHHKHDPDVNESYETNLPDVLKFIEKNILK